MRNYFLLSILHVKCGEIIFLIPLSGICDYKDFKIVQCLEIIHTRVVKNSTVFFLNPKPMCL